MKEAYKNKSILVIGFELVIIAIGIIGLTYATAKLLNDRASIDLKSKGYGVDYVGDTDIKADNLIPISDSLINIDSKENVLRVEFSLKSLKKNDDSDLFYDIMLKDINIDCGLLNKYTKWNLYKNNSLLSTGSLDPAFDGDVLEDNMHLTINQEVLPKSSNDYDKYVLILWISESCDDLENCELVDQSGILNASISMKVFVALTTSAKETYERIPNYDNSCISRPELSDNMVPINYQNGTWVVANSNNNDKDNLWYDYNNSLWANMVVVKDSTKYSEVGTTIDNNDVLGYFVWIPRFRYKLWNAEEKVTDSYDAYNKGISIVFESNLNEVTNTANNTYITHPAFENGLKGFWISKYEISKDNDLYRFVPNTDSYKDEKLDNYQLIASNISTSYKLDNLQSNIVNNYEWGATLYLSHSSYGICKDNKCEKLDVNSTYISGNDKQDSTTKNVYGVYDMAGASGEYVIGKSNNIGSATKEVILSNGDTWYKGHGLVSSRDYIIRGGINKELFYFGDINMDETKNSIRITLINK